MHTEHPEAVHGRCREEAARGLEISTITEACLVVHTIPYTNLHRKTARSCSKTPNRVFDSLYTIQDNRKQVDEMLTRSSHQSQTWHRHGTESQIIACETATKREWQMLREPRCRLHGKGGCCTTAEQSEYPHFPAS